MKQIFMLFFIVTFFSCQTKPGGAPAKQNVSSAQYKKNVSLLLSADQSKSGADRVPNFSWYDQNGKQVSFAEVSKGKPVLINFWATWCGPCVKETPDLVELNNEFASKGGLFIGISADLGDEAMDLVTEFTKEYKVPYQVVVDNNGELQKAFGGLRGYPTTFLIDKNGVIVKKMLGLQSKKKFADEFSAIL